MTLHLNITYLFSPAEKCPNLQSTLHIFPQQNWSCHSPAKKSPYKTAPIQSKFFYMAWKASLASGLIYISNFIFSPKNVLLPAPLHSKERTSLGSSYEMWFLMPLPQCILCLFPGNIIPVANWKGSEILPYLQADKLACWQKHNTPGSETKTIYYSDNRSSH